MTHQSTTCTIYNWKLETQKLFCQKKHFPSTFHPPSSPASTRHGTNTHPLGRLRANRGDPEPSTTSLALTPLRCVPSWSWIRVRTAEKNKGISWLIAWECTHIYIYMYIIYLDIIYIYMCMYALYVIEIGFDMFIQFRGHPIVNGDLLGTPGDPEIPQNESRVSKYIICSKINSFLQPSTSL